MTDWETGLLRTALPTRSSRALWVSVSVLIRPGTPLLLTLLLLTSPPSRTGVPTDTGRDPTPHVFVLEPREPKEGTRGRVRSKVVNTGNLRQTRDGTKDRVGR